jgi:hypothetical protein
MFGTCYNSDKIFAMDFPEISKQPPDGDLLKNALALMKLVTPDQMGEFYAIHSVYGIATHPKIRYVMMPFCGGGIGEDGIDYSDLVRLLTAIRQLPNRDVRFEHLYELLRGQSSSQIFYGAAAMDKPVEYPELPSCVELAAIILFNIWELNEADRLAELEKPPTRPSGFRNGQLEYFGFPIDENYAYNLVCEALKEPSQEVNDECSSDSD